MNLENDPGGCQKAGITPGLPQDFSQIQMLHMSHKKAFNIKKTNTQKQTKNLSKEN